MDRSLHWLPVFIVSFQMLQADFNNDPFVQDFGISVDENMVTVEGRVLPPPKLQYGGKINVRHLMVCKGLM